MTNASTGERLEQRFKVGLPLANCGLKKAETIGTRRKALETTSTYKTCWIRMVRYLRVLGLGRDLIWIPSL